MKKNLQYITWFPKKYNIEEIVRDKRGYYVFKPNTILGAKLSDSIFGLYLLKSGAWIRSCSRL